jgi:hypothetical protein
MGIDHRLRVVNLYNGLQPFTKEKYKVVSRLALNEDIKVSHGSVIKIELTLRDAKNKILNVFER